MSTSDPFRVPLLRTRLALRVAAVLVVLLVPLWTYWRLIWMPGEPTRRGDAQANQGLAEELRRDVEHLARDIGERNLRRPQAIDAAADWIEGELVAAGYRVARHSFEVDEHACHNLEVVLEGRSRETYVIGAHYDSAIRSPGANDNGSGVAVLLALARRLRELKPERTLRLVFYANEEPPYFQGPDMGSVRHARKMRDEGIAVLGMLSLETMGYFADTPRSQHYPGLVSLFYPDVGNFIAFVGDLSSRELTHRVIAAFRVRARVPSEGAALPRSTPGVGWSDHWSYWQVGYPALMVTDTAPFRYPHYHTPRDTPDKLDYARLARVAHGLRETIEVLAAARAQ